MSSVANAVAACTDALGPGVYRATKFLSEELVVKMTRRHKKRSRGRCHEAVLTIGKPNYAERQFIRACKKAGEPLPVKRVQLKLREGY